MTAVAKKTDGRVVDPASIQPADPMVSMIERIAMDPNSDLSKLEKMLEMKERLEAREARRAFDLAMADAKSEIKPIVKSGTVDYTNTKNERTFFKHETLDGIASAIDPILSSHGLSYRFRSQQHDGGLIEVTCIVAHRGGHSEETSLKGSRDDTGAKNNYQAVGSAVTYLQRYTLKLAFGLSAARDDDAVGAVETITEDQYRELRDLMEEVAADEEKFLRFMRIKNLPDLPAEKFDNARQALESKRGK